LKGKKSFFYNERERARKPSSKGEPITGQQRKREKKKRN